jgi:hypothetical protein
MSPLRRLRRLPARAAQSAPRGRGHGDTPTAAQHTRGLGLAARRSQCSSCTSLEAPQRTAGDRVHRAAHRAARRARSPEHQPGGAMPTTCPPQPSSAQTGHLAPVEQHACPRLANTQPLRSPVTLIRPSPKSKTTTPPHPRRRLLIGRRPRRASVGSTAQPESLRRLATSPSARPAFDSLCWLGAWAWAWAWVCLLGDATSPLTLRRRLLLPMLLLLLPLPLPLPTTHYPPTTTAAAAAPPGSRLGPTLPARRWRFRLFQRPNGPQQAAALPAHGRHTGTVNPL